MIPLSITLHGEPGTGKTPIAVTAPGRKLLLDVDGGSRFCALPRIEWDPERESPPTPGDWELCVVNVTGWAAVKAAVTYLSAGKHCFESIILDTLTDLQKSCREQIVSSSSNGKMTEAAWGVLLDEMERTLRDLRNTLRHRDNPTKCVVFVAQTEAKDGGMFRPLVQGGLGKSLPALTDLVGYLYVDEGTGPGSGRLLIKPTDTHLAKDRTTSLPSGGLTAKYGPVITGPVNITAMLDYLET